MKDKVLTLFRIPLNIQDNFIEVNSSEYRKNQTQTNEAFTEKWSDFQAKGNYEDLISSQKEWFKTLYGFENENSLKEFLSNKKVILDAGCGLGFKSAWLAELAPNAVVIGMDYSDAAKIASQRYRQLANLFFIQGDIANTQLKENSVDFVLCDQVIMHTENPAETFKHLSSITSSGGTFACYVYAKKALPRELLDDYFREATHSYSHEELWEMSRSLTQLGKQLSQLNIELDFPDIPLLGIKGGKQDLQRFIYWNFIKCFYREDWHTYTCDSTNFDWYSPSNANRYSKEEYLKMIHDNSLEIAYFHSEEACYSGRFIK
jgi:SAM-dependent methyltransferase